MVDLIVVAIAIAILGVSLWLYCFYKALKDSRRDWKAYDKALKDAGYV